MYENKVYEKWMSLRRGLPLDYHTRFADRIVACIGNWVPDNVLEDVLNDMTYHKKQVLAIQMEEEQSKPLYHFKE